MFKSSTFELKVEYDSAEEKQNKKLKTNWRSKK